MRSQASLKKRSTPMVSGLCQIKWLSLVISFLVGVLLSGFFHTHVYFRGDALLNARESTPAMMHLKSLDSSAKSNDKVINHDRRSILDGIKILVAIASFDFSQTPHLEEVLDGYHDLCVAGAYVNVVIHTTIPYTVALIDLLNTRLTCVNSSPYAGLDIQIVVKNPSVRLNLVDFHRTLFYENLQDFDLFIYSEDDILVTPKAVAAYLHETKRVETIVGKSPAEDFNVGIVRYEYNYPSEIIIDDKTRHATANVTRVYWEHPWHPTIPKSMDVVPHPLLKNNYVHMINHHQGMFFATRDLLQAWRKRPNCRFHEIRQRPGQKGNPHQPSQGTQRVWMSSHMLHGQSHCNVQQVIPMDNFGQLSLWHLPNKNYRRVGKHGRLGGDGGEPEKVEKSEKENKIEGASPLLPTAMQVHLEMRKKFPPKANPNKKYSGITMVNEVEGRYKGNIKRVNRRMKAYEDYVKRGGILSEEDMESWDWLADDY